MTIFIISFFYTCFGDIMKVYIDLVFFINFFFDFIIIYGTKYILKLHTKLYRIIIGSFIGSLSILLLFISLNNISLFILKLLISIVIIIVSFGRRNFFKNILYFYLISIILGGSIYLHDIAYVYDNKGLIFFNNGLSINIILIIIISPIIIYLYVKENKNYRLRYSNIYTIEIIINNKVYKLKSMLDTGNDLKDPYTKKNIILVNNNIISNINKYIYVPYKALNTSGIIKCFKADRIIINNKIFNNCLIGISNNNFDLEDIDCLLPNKLREDL